MRALLPAFAGLLTAGCMTTPEAPPAPPAPEARVCNAEAAQGHIGHDATAGMGAAILRDSGAQSLRWGPPNSAWTMDYRPDRVNVRYDESMKITEITCG
ncbi:I78 family peptidase inhibitor [Erythrobacter mangrovi]|uniref:Peptidase inhibitor I78 n=1 Tax=Erythrobacter mangrovi TaxID=2739433 RepID=A0A7D3XC46_9SPHN|nr:I78 family peptidase inhibitor [Erythrobacter mangrovi]QKG72130.1 hypothetical protein HQR01_12560 [Erythrobacter mangrovi]